MRQIYTSPRMENVERVVAMLAEAGIDTSVTNRRAYAGSDYKRPSYAAPAETSAWPQVWVVNAADQPRARALLREAGIEPAVRHAAELARYRGGEGGEQRRGVVVSRLRLFLLGCIVLIMLLYAFGVLKWS
ncbi:MAG TPA: hypothetical protein VFB32_09240 [Rudaea sp.]|nr:hypothetical protein [Rudaea sp.]